MKTPFCLFVIIILLTVVNLTAFGATKVSAKSGSFGFGSTWTDGIPPVAGDDIFIKEEHSVGGATGTINNLTVHGALTYSGLTVTGALHVGSSGSMGSLSGGFQLFLKGPSINNDGSISTQTRINGVTGQTISGGGVWTAGGEFTGAGEKTINNMNVPSGVWEVLSVVHVGGTWRLIGGSAGKTSTGVVKGNGSVLYEKAGGLSSNESTGNLWTVPITILATVTVSATSSVSAPIFIGSSGILSVSIHQVFEARSDLTVELGGQIMGQTVKLSGVNIINNGDIHPVDLQFNRAGDQAISGNGLWRTINTTTIGGSGEKSLVNSMSMTVGSLVIDSTLDINEHTLNFNAGSFRKSQTGTVSGMGKIIFRVSGSLVSDESAGNLFTAPVEINSGTRTVTGGISAPITIEDGATLYISAHVTLNARDDLTLKPGSSLMGQTLAFSGVNFVNDGMVSPVKVLFTREGNQTISGSGAWKSPNGIDLNGSGVKLLTSDVTMQTGALNVNTTLDVGGNTLTFVNGAFNKQLPGSVTGTGLVRFSGNGSLNSFAGNGNLFTASIEIVSGTRGPTASSGFDAPITVRSGATLNISANVTMNAKGDLTIEAGASVFGQILNFHGPNLVNNGTISLIVTFFKSGSHVLSGSGSFGNTAEMETGSSTVLHGVQQFQTLTLRSGSSFDISNEILKIGMNFNNSGTVTTTGSTIEYNRGNGDQTMLTNIAYHNLTINNPQQVFLNSAETVENILRLEKGTFEIGTNRLTIGNCGQIIRVGGALHGTPIFGNCINIAYEGGAATTTGTELPNTVTSLTIQNPGGVTLSKNTMVSGSLNLFSDLFTNNFIVTMMPAAVSTGTGDVIGTVRRIGLVNGVVYSFGNPLNSIRFDSGVPPAEVTMNLTKSAPGNLPNAILRSFYIDEIGGNAFTATLRLRYDDIDLNGNNESQLQFFHSNETWVPVAASSRDLVNNWVETSGVNSFSPWTLAQYVPPQEQTFEVTNQNDSGPGSLRQAISDANANPGLDTINLQGLSGVVTLTSGALQISESVSINGPGADQLTLSGANLHQVFVISPQDNNNSPLVVDINNLTVAYGYGNACGGGIYGSNVELNLNYVAVTESASMNGGGICVVGGNLNISNSTVDDNKAIAGLGGGIRIQSAETVNVVNSTITDNEAQSGGGISINGGTVNIVNSTVSHNTAASGGGILNEGTVNIRNTIVAANQAGVFPDVAGTFNSLGNNLIGAAENNQGFTDGVNGDKCGTTASPRDPKLGDLQDNGGTTKTRSLLTGSPAVEAGNNCVLTNIDSGGCAETSLADDQRGWGFPRSVGSAVDIGAFEASEQTGIALLMRDNCQGSKSAHVNLQRIMKVCSRKPPISSSVLT